MFKHNLQHHFSSTALNSFSQSSIEVMRLLLVCLLSLSVLTHGVAIVFYPNTLAFHEYCIAFGPAYVTLISSYLLVRASLVRWATHSFLLGMIVTQMLVVLFLTGPAVYVFVSYTNVVLVAGLMLGPGYGAVYTLLIVLSVSFYFYQASLGHVETNLLQKIEHGKELNLLATISCFIFTGTAVSYFVLRMAKLYQTAHDEKEKSNRTLEELEKLQISNEVRAKQGASIGWLGQQLVQLEHSQRFMQIAAEEIQRVLQTELALILVSTFDGYTISGVAGGRLSPEEQGAILGTRCKYQHDKWGDVQAFERPPQSLLRAVIQGQLMPYQKLENIASIPLVEVEQQIGVILLFTNQKMDAEFTFLTTAASILSSSLCRERAEENLRQFQKMETLGLLAGGIAHDFNNLLMTIVGNTEVALRKTADEPDVLRLLHQISRASNQASSLTHKLLTLSQQSDFTPETIEMNEVLRELLSIVQHAFNGGVTLDIEYLPHEVWVQIDRKDLQTALLNLVLNAKDAVGEQGEVGVSLSLISDNAEAQQQGWVQVQVSDNGCGIEPAALEKIFDPFFTTKSTGTGLGLTMVRSVVARANGKLSVESTGIGTTFTMNFPDKSSEQDVSISVLSAEYHTSHISHKGTILVVEDNALVRCAIVEMLEEGGYNCVSADSAADALLMLTQQKVDMILSDMSMPEKNGIELYHEVMHLFPSMPFVLMTGYASELGQQTIPVLKKPISLQDLLEKVQECMMTSKERKLIS